MALAWAGMVCGGLPAPARADEAAPGPVRIAVLGDSLSTGAATHPALTFDTKDLWKVFSGETSVATGLSPPQRLWPGPREFFGSGDWVWRNLLQGLSRHYLDSEEYSWGYVLATGLGVPPAELAIAGEDGARVEAIPRHMDRLLDATGGVLPEKVFLFYTGNDLCGPTMAYVTSSAEYEEDLRAGLEYMARNAKPGAGGSDVYVVGYLGVVQLINSDAILAKPVRAFGGESTCAKLREAGFRPGPDYDPDLPPEAWYFGLVMPPNPTGFCATLFGGVGATDKEREETIGALANRIRDYRGVQKKVVEELDARFAKERPARDLRLHYVNETTELAFVGEDIAGDCFHLSAHGQERVAKAIEGAVRGAAAR
jgi:hypothetical protein